MKIALGKLLVVENRNNNVLVVRFKTRDLRPFLDDYVDMPDCELFLELQEYALADFAPGNCLVLNLAPVEMVNTAVLRFLLLVRKIVRERNGFLVLCHVRDEHLEILWITQTLQLFFLAATEEEAIRKFWMAAEPSSTQ
ncbi:MAG TPA: STAS domain-containing protein [Gemmataceae bacterium]|jgi:anti-anti-sigma regulatory factor|nr:STAS domain-containing protein [Gemmataceae bacterium]